jgi:hypothetical protein
MKILNENRQVDLPFAVTFVSAITIGIGPTTVTYGKVEEQEGNLNGKIAKMQDVVDACSTMADHRGSAMEAVKEVLMVDCSEVLDAFNIVMSDVLRNNSESIENILYGR